MTARDTPAGGRRTPRQGRQSADHARREASHPATASNTGLAGLVRGLFVRCYRHAEQLRTGVPSTWGEAPIARWDGGTDDAGTHRPVWPKIVAFCIENQADPAAFIAAQFRNLASDWPLPRPNQLYGEPALARYRAYARDVEPDLRRALDDQREQLRVHARASVDFGGLSDRDAVGRALGDPAAALSGLFRHAIAVAYGYARIADFYHDAALVQYVFNRDAYDRAWAGIIPPALRDEAARAVGGAP